MQVATPAESLVHPRRNLAFTMLFIVGLLNFIDRQLLSVLIEPIRADMHFSDTQFGILTGIAFAMFYGAMGVPIAMAADRWNRVKLIGIACATWSIFTMACGMVSNFFQLALMRFGVGAGEAGGTAPSISVLADLYPPVRRPFIIGLYACNGPLGVFLGTAVGAWAAVHIGWRNAFISIGAIGLIIAPLLIWLVREPSRGRMELNLPTAVNQSFRESFLIFIRRPSLRMVLIGNGLASFVSFGMLNWLPAFLIRTQGMPLEAVGKWFAPAAGLAMGLGMFGSGWLVSRWAQRSARAYSLVPLLATIIMIPSLAVALLADSWQMSLALLFVPMVMCTAYYSPALAVIQTLAPPHFRATATAVLLLVFNLVGIGLGPLFIGIVSDLLKLEFGTASLRWALMATTPILGLAGIGQFIAMRRLEEDFSKKTA